MIYLASPYSHPSSEVRDERYRRVCEYAAILINQGNIVFSPIAHSHGIARFLPAEAAGFEYWQVFDIRMLRYCTRVVVLCLDGWKDSKGIAAEIEAAGELGLPVEYVLI